MFTLFLRHFQTIWWLVYYETIHPKLKSILCLQTRTFHFPHRASQPPQLLQHFRQMTHVIFDQFSQPQKAIKCVCFPSLQTAHKDYSNRLAKETLSRKKLHFLPLVSNNPKNLAKNRNFSVYLAFWSRVGGTAHLFQMRYTMAAIDGGTTVEVDSSNEMHGDIIRDDSWSQWVFGHLHLLDLFKEEQTTGEREIPDGSGRRVECSGGSQIPLGHGLWSDVPLSCRQDQGVENIQWLQESTLTMSQYLCVRRCVLLPNSSELLTNLHT